MTTSEDRASRSRPVRPAPTPVLPLRDIVVFPHMIVPLFVGREKSIRALEEVMQEPTSRSCSRRRTTPPTTIRRPTRSTTVGTLATVLQLLKLPDGTVKVLVEGVEPRARQAATAAPRTITRPRPRPMPDALGDQVEAEALARSVVSEFENYVKLNKKVSPEVVAAVDQIDDYSKLADTVASHLAVKIPDKQAILETADVGRAAREGARPDGERDLRAAGREAHPLARQAPDGEDPARVLPQRADEGDPEGARRRGRPDELAELEEQIEKTKLSKEAREKAHGRAEEAAPDVADVGRGDGRAQLSRLAARHPVGQALEDQERPRRRRRRSSTTIISAWRRSRSGSSSTSPCRAGQQAARARSCASSALPASARPRSASRSPRRPAASSCACRSAACATRPRSAATGAPISARCPARSSSRCARPRRSNPLFLLDEIDKMGMDFRGDPSVGAARGARSRAELDLQRPLPRGRLRPVERDVRDDGEHAQHPAGRCSTAWRSSASPATPRTRRSRSRGSHLIPKAIKKHGLEAKELSIDDEGLLTLDPPLHPRGRRAQPRARALEPGPQGGEGDPDLEDEEGRRSRRRTLDDFLGVPKFRYGEAEDEDQVGVVDRPCLDRGRRRAPDDRGRA